MSKSIQPSPVPKEASTAVPGKPRLLAWLFFVSGVLALIYEVLWQRQFAAWFGSGAPATAAVLAAFFTGLAGGSLAVGRFALNWRRPLRAYALLEFGIASGALLVTPILHGLESVAAGWFLNAQANFALSFASKLLLCFLALGIPTFCMGGTLPLLGQWIDSQRSHLGRNAGLLYLANTAGAGLGAVLVPFALLPWLGAQAAVWVCALANGLIGAAALALDRSVGPLAAAMSEQAPAPQRIGAGSSAANRGVFAEGGVLILAGVSGFATLALQVLWNRAFAQIHENSMHSFAIIVAVFLFALAAGSQAARVALARGIAAERLLIGSWLAGGLLAAAAPWVFLQLTGSLGYLPSGAGWGHYASRLVPLAGAVVFVPVFFLGIGLPAILEQAGHLSRRSTGDVLGRTLAANLIGAIAGALAGGFLFPHWIGLWHSMLVIAGLVILAAFRISPAPSRKSPQRVHRKIAVGALAAILIAAGTVNFPRVQIAPEEGERLLAISEGVHGITAVVERPGSRRLKLNNHYVLGGTASAGDERMQAHLPLLLHPNPRHVAFLGLGTGITASGALFHPIEKLTAVELVPEILTAARDYFREANASVLEDARTTIIVDDARSWIRNTPMKFDVIIGDLVVPWRQGEGALFTLEHFQSVQRALAPDGLFCQWLPMFQLAETELQILLRTYLSVFPNAQIWRGDFAPKQPAIALVTRIGTALPNAGDVRRRVRELRADPFNPHLSHPSAVWMFFVGTIDQDDLPGEERRMHREDSPWLELLGPLQHAGANSGQLLTGRRLERWLREIRQPSAPVLAGWGREELGAQQSGALLSEFTLALSEGRESAAESLLPQIRALIPEPLFQILFP